MASRSPRVSDLQKALRVAVEDFGAVFGAEQNTPICVHLLTPNTMGDDSAPHETGQTHEVLDQ
jgi:hypothetical protein